MAFRRYVLAAAAFLCGLACAQAATAATVYTYTFEQTGYAGYVTLPSSWQSIKVTGGFTGAADAIGTISLNSLTDFHIELSGFPQNLSFYNLSQSGLPSFFAFHVGDAGTLGVLVQIADFHLVYPPAVCIGAPVGILCNGGNARGFIQFYGVGVPIAASNSAPVLTLVSVTQTPIPASLLLFVTTLGGLGVLAWSHRGRHFALNEAPALQ